MAAFSLMTLLGACRVMPRASAVSARDSDFHSALTSSFWNFLHEGHLKLEGAKGPAETFVIDGAEKPLPD